MPLPIVCFSVVMRRAVPSLLVVLLAMVMMSGQSPRTFYVGHSLSDQIPDMVQSLSDDHPNLSFSWVYQSIPGAPLRWQWDRKEAMDYGENPPQFIAYYNDTAGLSTGAFDALVLTEAVPRYLDIIDETYAYADSFMQYALAGNPNIQIYLYEDWHCILSGTPTGCSYDVDSNPWRQRLTDDLTMWESVVDSLNFRHQPKNPVCMIPGGQGLAAMYDSIQEGNIPFISQIEDLFSDNIHLNDTGKYFIACIHFAAIHGISPVGLTNQLQHWWGGDLGAPPLLLAQKMQEMAWETVLRYPKSCVSDLSTASVTLEEDCLSIAPNPSNNIFRIDGISGTYTIEVLDQNGQLHQSLSNSTLPKDIFLHALPAGMYFIRIVNDSNTQVAIEKNTEDVT